MLDFIYVFLELFFEMALYLMIGLFFVGFLFIFVSKDKISKQIGGNSLWSIAKASLFGVPLPLCSCGVVPSAVYLSKNGASKPAVISFLTSTPQTGVDSIIATYGLMGPVFAIFRPIAALLIGIAGGLFVRFFDSGNEKEIHDILDNTSEVAPVPYSNFSKKLLAASRYSFVEFLDDIAPQFLVGLLIAALITYFVPDSFFEESILSSGIVGMLLMIAIGAPMYVCATASIPIAVSLLLKGFSPGVAFVFLAVGPATNAASFAILMKVLGRKVSLMYLFILAILSIAFGYLLDFIFNYFDLNPISMLSVSNHHHHHEDGIGYVSLFFGSIFLILILASIYRLYLRKYFTKIKVKQGMTTLRVIGMNCNHCVNNVSKVISSFDGVESVDVDLSTETASISGEINTDELIKKIEEVGYKAERLNI